MPEMTGAVLEARVLEQERREREYRLQKEIRDRQYYDRFTLPLPPSASLHM